MATKPSKSAPKPTKAAAGTAASEQAVRSSQAEPDAEAAPANPPAKAAPAKASRTQGTKSAPATAAEAPAEGGGEEGEGEVFLNRAQRRSKGRNPSQAQFGGRGKVVSGHGPASTQRNWANRRSG